VKYAAQLSLDLAEDFGREHAEGPHPGLRSRYRP
jgi:hypothetical protein